MSKAYMSFPVLPLLALLIDLQMIVLYLMRYRLSRKSIGSSERSSLIIMEQW